MVRFLIIIYYLISGALESIAQSPNFSPEIVLGNRSAAYQHFIGYSLDDKWSFNNLSLFDKEYINDKNNIFFIRNMLSYKLNNHFKANAAFGIKNPGTFATLSSQYEYTVSEFKLSYSIGTTYQNGFTLEQTLFTNYTPRLSKKNQAYISLLVVVSTNLNVFNRGIKQLRLGLKKVKFITGIAINLDQFTGGEKRLENFGIFIRYRI